MEIDIPSHPFALHVFLRQTRHVCVSVGKGEGEGEGFLTRPGGEILFHGGGSLGLGLHRGRDALGGPARAGGRAESWRGHDGSRGSFDRDLARWADD